MSERRFLMSVGSCAACALLSWSTTAHAQSTPTDETEALKKIEGQLAKSPRRPGKGEVVEAADGDVESDNDDIQEEAA